MEGILQTVMGFISSNIAYILLVVGVLYFVWFFYSLYRAKKHGEEFGFRIKYAFAFAVIIGFAIYCLVTGQDLKQFVG